MYTYHKEKKRKSTPKRLITSCELQTSIPMQATLIKKSAGGKILVLASTFPRWANDSTPPFVFELEKRLAKQFNIFLLAPHFLNAKKSEILENIKIYRFQYFWPARYQKLCYEGGIAPNLKKNKLLTIQALTLIIFELIAAIRIVRKEKIQMIHAHWIIPQGIIALAVKKIFNIPYVVTTHGGDIYGLQNKIMIYVKKMVLENAKKVTVVSTAIKKETLRSISKDLDIDVISMGVDAKSFHPDNYQKTIKERFSPRGPLVLFVGRLAEKKGVEYALEAMPEIINKFPNMTFLIIGEGPKKAELEQLSHKLKINKQVIFLGGLPNTELPKYYASAEIFIGPSIQTKDGDTEGLGLTFVEASFSGCIPIGTKIGGIGDVILDGETGLLVEEKNAKAISDAVIKLLKNQMLMKKMKQKAREYTINKFDWNIIAKKYKEVYESNL